MSSTRFCKISSVISSSSKTTISLIERRPRFKSSPRASTCWITMGERESAFSAVSCPRSMRLAISTSSSRVSSGEAPISRRYTRTGSLAESGAPGVRSSSTSSVSCASPSFQRRVRRMPTRFPPHPGRACQWSRANRQRLAENCASWGSRSFTSSSGTSVFRIHQHRSVLRVVLSPSGMPLRCLCRGCCMERRELG